MRLVILFLVLTGLKGYASDTLKCPSYYDSTLAMTVYEFADVEPSFPGGEADMLCFIRQNLALPEMNDSIQFQTTTYVEFVVSTNGKLLNVTASYPGSLSTSPFDEEAIRMVQLMPDWVPGSCNGIPVAIKYRFPIEVYIR